ncbi:MAG: hypothetical protein PHY48_17815 [Candidatus Cloacimonetes bacterium]|nr:hypothetical protein [Candidatus Cloacimonadota bacterium]
MRSTELLIAELEKTASDLESLADQNTKVASEPGKTEAGDFLAGMVKQLGLSD